MLGRKEKAITLSVVDSRAISSNWYLYVSIDKPLTTPDEKHLLQDSLIFMDENKNMTTLSSKPTLIYSGTGNDGNTKTTDITWNETTGILFKVIDPLYNGETYSTLINWKLTNELLN